MRRRLWGTGALLLALSGCSGGAEPIEPGSGGEASPSPSASAAAPTLPAQAREEGPEGAVAFVTYWLALSDYAAESGDTEELDARSSALCGGCDSYISYYRNLSKAGGAHRGSRKSLSEVSTAPGSDEATFVSATVTLTDGELRKNASSDFEPTRGESTRTVYRVRYQDDQWVMLEMVLEENL